MHYRDRTNRKYLIFSLLAAVIFIGTFAFYGCQFFQPQNEPQNIDEQPQSRRIGIIKSLGGIRTSNQGTHLLQLDNGDTILLKSLQINLDDSKYVSKTVEVSGILTYTTDNKQIMEVMSIDVMGDRESQQVFAPAWKNFSNPTMGISMKYRDDLVVDESSGNGFSFKRDFMGEVLGTQAISQESEAMPQSLTHRMEFRIDDLAEGISLMDYIKKIYPELKGESPADLLSLGISRSKIGSDSIDAFKKVNTDSGASVVYYYALAGNRVFIIKLESGNDDKTIEDQNLFYEMLGTLSITGSTGKQSSQEVPGEDMSDRALPTLSAGSEKSGAVVPDVNADGQNNVKKTIDLSADENFKSVETTDNGTGDESPVEDTGATQAPISGYTTMQSDSFKFAVQYPKNWFYSGAASSEAGVIRHYDFGTKPLDEADGIVSMDLMTGSIPAGSSTVAGNNTVTKVSSGDTVTVYVKGSGSRIYRFSGPSSEEQTLIQIAGSVQD